MHSLSNWIFPPICFHCETLMETNKFLFCSACQELFQVEEIESDENLKFFRRKKDAFWVFPDEGPIKTLPALTKQYPTMMKGLAGFCVYQILRYCPYPDFVCSLAAFEDRAALDVKVEIDSELLAREIARILRRPMKKSFLNVEKDDLEKEILFVGGYFQEEIIEMFQQEGSFIKKKLCFLVKKEERKIDKSTCQESSTLDFLHN